MIVGSSSSVVSGSSLIAVTSSEFPGLLAVTVTTFEINPVSSTAWVISKVAVYVATSPLINVPWVDVPELETNDKVGIYEAKNEIKKRHN